MAWKVKEGVDLLSRAGGESRVPACPTHFATVTRYHCAAADECDCFVPMLRGGEQRRED